MYVLCASKKFMSSGVTRCYKPQGDAIVSLDPAVETCSTTTTLLFPCNVHPNDLIDRVTVSGIMTVKSICAEAVRPPVAFAFPHSWSALLLKATNKSSRANSGRSMCLKAVEGIFACHCTVSHLSDSAYTHLTEFALLDVLLVKPPGPVIQYQAKTRKEDDWSKHVSSL